MKSLLVLTWLQWRIRGHGLLSRPIFSILAFLGLGALYGLCLGFVFPLGGKALEDLFTQTLALGGGQAGMLLLALMHVFLGLALVGPLGGQMRQYLSESSCVRLIHLRLRRVRLLAAFVNLEALCALIVVEVVLFPLLWKPFWVHLSLVGLFNLFACKIVIWFATLLLADVSLAVYMWMAPDEHSLRRLWIAAGTYYGTLMALGWSIYRVSRTERFQELLVSIFRPLRYAADGRHIPHMILLALLFAALTVLFLMTALSRALESRGV